MFGSRNLCRNASIAAWVGWLGGESSTAQAMPTYSTRAVLPEYVGGSRDGIPLLSTRTISKYFDELGRLKETWLKKTDRTALGFYRYTYDPGWRRSRYFRHNNDKLVIGYDDLGQVTSGAA